jgi:protein TonB
MRGNRDTGQHASDVTALVLTGGLAAMLLATSRPAWITQPAQDVRSSSGIELSVETAPIPTPAAPPPVVPRRMPMRHTPSPPAAVPVSEAAALPLEQQAMPEDASLVASDAPATAQQAANVRPDIDAQYAAQLRADIDRRTHPPDTAQYRLHRPSGEVHIRFVVMRNGAQKNSTLVRSSGSPILDEAALMIVTSGHYAPMPAAAFVGEQEHAFIVTIEFRAANLILGAR